MANAGSCIGYWVLSSYSPQKLKKETQNVNQIKEQTTISGYHRMDYKLKLLHVASFNVMSWQIMNLLLCNVCSLVYACLAHFPVSFMSIQHAQHHPGGGSHSVVSHTFEWVMGDAASSVSCTTRESGSILSSESSVGVIAFGLVVSIAYMCERSLYVPSGGSEVSDLPELESVPVESTSCSCDNASLMNGEVSAFRADTLLMLNETTVSVSSHLVISGVSYALAALVCLHVMTGDVSQSGTTRHAVVTVHLYAVHPAGCHLRN